MLSNRETVLLVLFDLSVKTKKQRREYRRFRADMLTMGFTQLQKSVYFKMLSNVSSVDRQKKELKKRKPRVGIVQFLPMPLGVFLKLESLIGPQFEFSKELRPVLEFIDD